MVVVALSDTILPLTGKLLSVIDKQLHAPRLHERAAESYQINTHCFLKHHRMIPDYLDWVMQWFGNEGH